MTFLKYLTSILLVVRTVGDLVFDIVKEVIADTLSGLFARGLGLHTTARNGGDFSFINTVLGAVSKVASGQRC